MTRRRTGRPKSHTNRRSPPESSTGDRLQKVLAAAGIGSRRDCEELIVAGRVEVDRQTVTQLGTRVDPLHQEIRVDGVSLPKPRRVYYMLNKPTGVVCTNDDPGGRVRAVDLIRSDERLFTIGRLDRTSEGMILITNDGELANQLTHPRYGVEKHYLVRIVGSPNPVIFEKLRQGIHLAEGVARVSDIRVRKRSSRFTDVEIVLQEGRNREIRRILARIGHKVVRLKRIAIGPLRLGELPAGASRPLTRDEVRKLRDSAASKRRRKKPRLGNLSARAPQEQGNRRPLDDDSVESLHGVKPSKARPDRRERERDLEKSNDQLAPAAVDDDADEVEVLEVPEGLPTGSIIGDDSDFMPSHLRRPQQNNPPRRKRRPQ